MKYQGFAFLVCGAALAAGAACESVLGSLEPSWFLATLEGEVNGEYTGTGSFSDDSRNPDADIWIFSINSRGEGSSAGQSFHLYREGRDRPGIGTYSIVLRNISNPDVDGFNSFYTRTHTPEGSENDWYEMYAVQSGEVMITASSKDRLEGTFHLTGFRYCAHENGTSNRIGPCRMPEEPILDAPTIEVSGSFSVAPFDNSGVVAD